MYVGDPCRLLKIVFYDFVVLDAGWGKSGEMPLEQMNWFKMDPGDHKDAEYTRLSFSSRTNVAQVLPTLDEKLMNNKYQAKSGI